MTQQSGFNLLDKAHLALLASQVALAAGWAATSGLNSLSGGFLMLVLSTALVAGGARRLAEIRLNRGAAGWVIVWRTAGFAVLLAATVLVAWARFLSGGLPAATPQLLVSSLWLVVALKGAAVGKLSPDAPIGLRIPWTLNSRLAWEKAHRTLGRILFWGGVMGLVVSMTMTAAATFGLWLCLVATALIFALIEAWRTFRADPERLL